jgi:hypothetical protein
MSLGFCNFEYRNIVTEFYNLRADSSPFTIQRDSPAASQ